ncbi:MAG: GNAT family N-acetyltransferase [Chrysiogenales bacterium]|nr:MAG: GNAT family N-acetyltransferase [Chrysiogenales bacterium]
MKKTGDENIFSGRLTLEPLSRGNWEKFVALFGGRGACGNCWCMYYRLKNQEFAKGKENEANKKAMKKLVWDEKPAGLLGLFNGRAIAWCAFAPRRDFLKLENSRVHRRIDDQPVWSVPCFFVDKKFRRRGVSVAILKALIKYAKKKKIKVIEGYPVISTQGKLSDAFAWVGLYRSFEKAGFAIVDRTSKNRPMVRYYTCKME